MLENKKKILFQFLSSKTFLNKRIQVGNKSKIFKGFYELKAVPFGKDIKLGSLVVYTSMKSKISEIRSVEYINNNLNIKHKYTLNTIDIRDNAVTILSAFNSISHLLIKIG